MYHPDVIEARLAAAKKNGLKFKRLSRETSAEYAASLESLRKSPKGELLPNGQLSRPLTDGEKEFITSERILCKADFSYYLSRYHVVERDPGVGEVGGAGAAPMLESQVRFVRRLGDREKVCVEEKKKHGYTAGILVYAHKCRQVVFTSTARGATLHRMLFYPGTRALAATLKEGPAGTGELYARDTLSIDNLPFWLKPNVFPRVKDEQIGFESPLSSRVSYQAENQSTGIGTGTQVDVSHLTEVPLWSYPGRIRYSFMPALPKAISTLHIQEGTSAGKGGYWQEVSEGCRHRREGFEDYIYIFVPWYTNVTKYRKVAPANWIPKEHTLKHADLIERTSPEFNWGVTVRATRDQLYWWETERELQSQNGELASFLANYPATPEQSFVNWAQGALPAELIEEMELNIRQPIIYYVETGV